MHGCRSGDVRERLLIAARAKGGLMRRSHVGSLVTIVVAALASAFDAAAQSTSAFRGRIVGVYDENTGNPIAGVEVRNLLNGVSALTTPTGTVLLTFVDTSG